MSYCFSVPWLSDYNFQKVIDHRAQLAANAARAPVAASNPRSDMLVLWGGAVDGEPPFPGSWDDPSPLPSVYR